MSRIKFPPVIDADRMVVVIVGPTRDIVLERREDMPVGAWGEVKLPPDEQLEPEVPDVPPLPDPKGSA